MASKRTRSLALGSAGVLAAGVGMTVWLVSGPPLNQAQARAMLPAVNAYLDKNAGKLGYGWLDTWLKPRMFCDASIIGITPDGLRWRVSMVMNCGEYARRGNTLLQGAGGYPGIGEVMILSGRREGYQGLSLKIGPPHYDKAWADQNLLWCCRRCAQRQPAHRARPNPPGLAGIRLPGRNPSNPGLTPHARTNLLGATSTSAQRACTGNDNPGRIRGG